MLNELTYEEYAAQVNTKFQLTGTSPVLEITLTEVSEKKETPRQEMFALIFTGANDFFLPQQTYELSHETLGDGMLFLVPIGRDENGVKYEAVFNRLIN